jgi:hypothetical protein
MPLCYCLKGCVLKMVSIRNSKAIGGEEADIAATWGHEKKGDCEGEVYKKQETSEPCIYLS